MSLIKRLFGSANDDNNAGSGPVSQTEHEGYKIETTPQKEGGQYRLCAVISKQIEGETKEHLLIRADMFSSSDEAAQAAIRKAHQVIKEQGDRMFD